MGTKFSIIFVLFSASAFGALTVTDRGISGNNVSSANISVSPSGNMSAGSLGMIVFGGQNANGSSANCPLSVTDSAGNVWKRSASTAAGSTNAGTEVAVYTCLLTSGLTTSGTFVITFTTANVGAKGCSIIEIAPGAGKAVVVNTQSTTGFTGTSGTPTETTPNVIINGVVVGYGIAHSGDTWTGDSDTSSGSWTTKQSGGWTNSSLITQEKTVTATATQTYNPTLTSAVVRLGYVIVQECDNLCRSMWGDDAGATATLQVNFQRPLTLGSLGVICVAADNANAGSTNFPTTLTDTQSNTWTLREHVIENPAGANSGAELGMYTSVLTTGLSPATTATDNVVITWTTANVTAKAYAVWEFATATAFNTGGTGTAAASSAPTITTSSITAGHIVVGMMAAEGNYGVTAVSDTTNGSWSNQAQFGGIAGLGSMALATQYKITTGTGTQTYNPVPPASSDLALGWVDLTAPAPAVNNNAQFFLNFFP